MRDGIVHKLNAESEGIENLEMDLKIFLNKALDNPAEFLSFEPLLQFMPEGGELEQGQSLNVYPPFITGESADGVSLKAISMFERIAF